VKRLNDLIRFYSLLSDLAQHTGGARLILKVRWQDAGIKDGLLFMPTPAPGAMRKSPRAQGELLSALLLEAPQAENPQMQTLRLI
jgi:hypothetical protein